MTTTFLHISDLHLRGDWPEQSGKVLAGFFIDLEKQLSRYQNVFLIFSGDLVHEGEHTSQYSDFSNIFSDNLQRLGIGPDRRIVIPGNHDASRASLRPNLFIQRSTLNAISTEEHFLNQLTSLEGLFFSKTFENYKQYERSFASYTCCQKALGGQGHDFAPDVGVFCLNTALTTCAGLKDNNGEVISDKGKLQIDTNSLTTWLLNNKAATRILVMHHPLDWLTDWAQHELSLLIAKSFDVVLCGHVHRGASTYATRGTRGAVTCIAPALFSRKSDRLGYSFIIIDQNSVQIAYREWTPDYLFVDGNSFSGTDNGRKRFERRSEGTDSDEPPPVAPNDADTEQIIRDEFEEATIS